MAVAAVAQAVPPAAAAPGGGRQGGRGGAATAQAPAQTQGTDPNPLQQQPGLYRGVLPGGHQLVMMVADMPNVETREATVSVASGAERHAHRQPRQLPVGEGPHRLHVAGKADRRIEQLLVDEDGTGRDAPCS